MLNLSLRPGRIAFSGTHYRRQDQASHLLPARCANGKPYAPDRLPPGSSPIFENLSLRIRMDPSGHLESAARITPPRQLRISSAKPLSPGLCWR